MKNGRIQLDNLILRCENLSEVTPTRDMYEDWMSEEGNFQINVGPGLKQVSFQTSVRTNRENLLKELNGKTVTASSSLFDTFECVVTSQRYSVASGTDRAIYEITLKEDSSRVQK